MAARDLQLVVRDAIAGTPRPLSHVYDVVRSSGALGPLLTRQVVVSGVALGAHASHDGLEACYARAKTLAGRLRSADTHNYLAPCLAWCLAALDSAWPGVCRRRRDTALVESLRVTVAGLRLDPMDTAT